MKKWTAVLLLISMTAGLLGCGDTQAPGELPAVSEAAVEASGTAEGAAAPKEASVPASDGEIRFQITLKRMETAETTTQSADVGSTADPEPFPWGYVCYPAFAASEGTKAGHPALSELLDSLNKEYYDRALRTLAEEAAMVTEWSQYTDDGKPPMYGPNEQNWETEVMRADEKLLSFLVQEESWYNGPHPFTDYSSRTFDVGTGEGLPLSDVVNEIRELPELILKNLSPLSEDYQFSEAENAEMLPKIQEMVAEQDLPWTIDDVGLHFYFNAYALQYYAFGPIFCDLPFKTYPNLVKEEYLPRGDSGQGAPLAERITYSREDDKPEVWKAEDLTKYYEPAEYETSAGDDETLSGPAPTYQVECPDWSVQPYLAEGVKDPIGESLVTLTEEESARESTDWLDQTAWSGRTEIPLPRTGYDAGGYSDANYYYVADNRAEDGILKLELANMGYYDMVGIYDFSAYLNTPTPGNQFTVMEIPYARVVDGILYVELAHRTYSADQPCTGFLVAVEMSTGRVLWRSEMLRANARNFEIIDDQIICGYGFTDEDDYLYILSRHSGEVLEHWKLKTGPDYFIRQWEAENKEVLWVLTYNTAYKYVVSYG